MPVNPNFDSTREGIGHWNNDADNPGYTYPDGTFATLSEINDYRRHTGQPLLTVDVEGHWTGDSAKILQESLHNGPTGRPGHVRDDSPGAKIDTTAADEERARLGALLGQLQQQAATGSGSWEKTLKTGTESAKNMASALGQSTPNTDYQSALTSIGNAQSAADQRAVGQGNILRAQAQQNARGEISGLLSDIGGQDANQAVASSDAEYGLRALNASATQRQREGYEKDQENMKNTALNAVGGAAQAAFSDGGKVPGRPRVFGDDERNDTVPAMLSAGEIVIPRSHAGSPESAAAFVRALQARRSPLQHLASGGTLQEEASINNGGLLNTAGYDANRKSVIQHQNLLQGDATGGGPSVVPQQMQNSTDSTIAAAMQGNVNSRGGGTGSNVLAAGKAAQDAAGNAAGTSANEQQGAQGNFLRSLLTQRNQDMAMAQAKQKAAWRNTQLNAGISLADQALMQQVANANADRTQRMLSGSAQGFSALSNLDFSSPKSSDDYARGTSADLHGYDSGSSEWGNPYDDGKWKGGEIGSYADGGAVDVEPLMPVITERTPKNPSVMVTAGKPEITGRTRNVEGNVFLQNTLGSGKKERGQSVRRDQFPTDDAFDAFVANQKEQGNLWEPQTEVVAAEPSPFGGGFLSSVRHGLATMVGPHAMPMGEDEKKRSQAFIAALGRRAAR